MLCFQVDLNGARFCTAGIDSKCVLSAHVTFVDVVNPGSAPRRTLDLTVGGLDTATKQSIHWGRAALAVGDRIGFTILNADSADPPLSIVEPLSPPDLASAGLKHIRARRKVLLQELKNLDKEERRHVRELKSTKRARSTSGQKKKKKKK